jgi:hypothetical protein
MTTPTHILTGYMIGEWFIAKGALPIGMAGLAITVSILAANGPDFDVILYRTFSGHRNSPLHTPFYWFIPLSIMTLTVALLGYRILSAISIMIDINVFLHFLMDSISIGCGIRWLAPFKQQEYGLVFARGNVGSFKAHVKNNLRYPVILLDVVFWIYFLAIGRRLF